MIRDHLTRMGSGASVRVGGVRACATAPTDRVETFAIPSTNCLVTRIPLFISEGGKPGDCWSPAACRGGVVALADSLGHEWAGGGSIAIGTTPKGVTSPRFFSWGAFSSRRLTLRSHERKTSPEFSRWRKSTSSSSVRTSSV